MNRFEHAIEGLNNKDLHEIKKKLEQTKQGLIECLDKENEIQDIDLKIKVLDDKINGKQLSIDFNS